MTEAGSGSFGGACPSRRPRYGWLAVRGLTLLCLAAAAGCGDSSQAQKGPAPQRVCRSAEQAARKSLGTVVMRIADSDPTNIECVLEAGGSRVDAVAQAATQAWTEYETTTVHQVQAYAAGPTRDPAQIPQNVSIAGAQASWIPAQHEIVATNGTQSSAGSYVTVTLTGAAAHASWGLRVARAIAAAVLATAPRGESPGPPPS